MKNFIFGLLKLLAACFGPLCMLYSEKLFDKYFTSEKNNSDEIYSVILNNHGSYRYITEAQDQHIKIFLGLAVLWACCLFIAIYIIKFRK